MTLNEESNNGSRNPDDYPLMAVRDARQTERAFELFDNILGALEDLALSEQDAKASGISLYSTMAEVLRKRNWDIDESS